jgi:hypothetical protein
MCSLDHKIMMKLKLGQWRDGAARETVRRRYPRSPDLKLYPPKRETNLFTTIVKKFSSALKHSQK